MRQAGMMLIDRGQPNNALKIIQLGQVRLHGSTHPGAPVVASWLHVETALAQAKMGQVGEARSALAAARDGYDPPTTHAQADMDLVTALVWLELGQTDAAQAAVARAVQTFGADRREGVVADITLARLHVRAGEPRGLILAKTAIDGVAPLRSRLARQWLTLLAQDLETRPGSDAHDLARAARQVAA